MDFGKYVASTEAVLGKLSSSDLIDYNTKAWTA